MPEWTTVSIPRSLAEDIAKLIDEIGYWPSLGAFTREAIIEKMNMERINQRNKAEAAG